MAIIIIIVVAAIAYMFGKNSIQTIPTQYIFDNKTFNHYKNGSFESLYVAGTLTGDGVGYNDNTMSIMCAKDKMECLVNSIQGISKAACQLSRLGSPTSYPITKWDNYSIVATDASPYDTFSCTKNTINIDLQSQVAELVQEPINQSSLSCKDFNDTKIYKWTIDDPQWYKDFKNSLKK